MSLYYPGYSENKDKVLKYTDVQLLDLLDALYGRNNLPCQPTHEELLAEALRQHRIEWADKGSTEYDQVTFWKKVYRADNRRKWLTPEVDGD